MFDSNQHDRLIAKLQYFGDAMKQRCLEKEALSIVFNDKDLKEKKHVEILIYQEIIDNYYECFKDILHR